MAILVTARRRIEQAETSARPVVATVPTVRVAVSVLLTLVATNALVLLAEPSIMYIARFDQQHTVAHIVDLQLARRPDVMFMGTSRSLSGFDPSVAEREIESLTGQKIYAHNMSLTGGT